MNYAQAREMILNAGWQSNNKRWQDVPEHGRVKDVYYDNGWHEVDDCAGTGTAPCRFQYSDIHGNTLVMITEGECYNANFEPLKEGEKCDLGVNQFKMLSQINQAEFLHPRVYRGANAENKNSKPKKTASAIPKQRSVWESC